MLDGMLFGLVFHAFQQWFRYGLPEGTLVKISCLEPATSSGIRGAAETLEVAEGQATAHTLAAVAEAETMDPAAAVRSAMLSE